MGRLIRRVAFASGLLCLTVHAEQLRIAVAANFRSTLEQLVEDYAALAPGVNISLSSASSGVLYNQIVNGAPFDLFLSADGERPARLEAEGLIEPHTRFTYAIGQLALWHDGPIRVDDQALAHWQGRIAMANPRLAPYGEAAQQTLETLGLWSTHRRQLVTGASISQAFQFVYSGNLQLGFVSYSQWLESGLDRGQIWLVPETLFSPIEQQVVVLKQARSLQAAQAFVAYLQSPAAEVIIRQAGYRLTGPEVAMSESGAEPDGQIR